MSTEQYIGLIGTFASIFGAVVALWQSKKALDIKKETEKIRDQFEKKYLINDLSGLRTEIKSIVNRLTRYKDNNSLEGFNLENDIQDLRRLVNEIRSNKIYSTDIEHQIKSILDQLENPPSELKLDRIIDNLTDISRKFDNNINKK